MRALPPLAICATLLACPRAPATAGADGGAALASRPGGGDVRRGWTLYQEHCAACHGDSRRGDGERAPKLSVHPTNLRDPLLLATRTDDQLANAISQGGPFVGKSRVMPAFHEELSERDVLDLLALLRGDALALEDCFPGAAAWARLTPPDSREPVLAAYALQGPRAGRPRVTDGGRAPDGATLVGLALLTEVSLPRAGATPAALLVGPSGELHGVRVGLPPGEREKAQRDLESALRSGQPGELGGSLGRLSAMARGLSR